MQFRYDSSIHFNFPLDESIRSRLIPSMIIQPLVENAIIHGLNQMLNAEQGDASIEILAVPTKTALLLKIRDNGSGFTKRDNCITEAASKKSEKTGGAKIGITNINERIQSQYGKDYGVTYRRTADNWTEILVSLPYLGEGAIEIEEPADN